MAQHCSFVLWITGLPGAGKTTIAREIIACLKESHQMNAIFLDGDELREVLSNNLYTFENRKALAYTYIKLCKLLVNQGHSVVCSTVSLFEEVRQWARENVDGYVEVFVDCPYECLLKRNKKNLYSSDNNDAWANDSMSKGYVLPSNPSVHVLNDGTMSINEMATYILREGLSLTSNEYV